MVSPFGLNRCGGNKMSRQRFDYTTHAYKEALAFLRQTASPLEWQHWTRHRNVIFHGRCRWLIVDYIEVPVALCGPEEIHPRYWNGQIIPDDVRPREPP